MVVSADGDGIHVKMDLSPQVFSLEGQASSLVPGRTACLTDPLEPLSERTLNTTTGLKELPKERPQVSWPWSMCVVTHPHPDPWLALDFLPMLVRHSPLE